MAQNFIDFSKKHAVAGSSRLRATITGDIYNIKIAKDMDNGSIVGKGAYAGSEYYTAVDATTLNGTIIEQAANGNFYVEVSEAENAYILIQVPLTYYEFSTAATHESTFYNASGDIVRAYKLQAGDVFELSKEGFVGGTPVANKTVSLDTTKKHMLKVGA